jgi:hypothetical protein
MVPRVWRATRRRANPGAPRPAPDAAEQSHAFPSPAARERGDGGRETGSAVHATREIRLAASRRHRATSPMHAAVTILNFEAQDRLVIQWLAGDARTTC